LHCPSCRTTGKTLGYRRRTFPPRLRGGVPGERAMVEFQRNRGGSLILKRATASRPSGSWSEDDYDVLPDGIVIGPHLEGTRGAGRDAVAMDARLRAARRSHTDARLWYACGKLIQGGKHGLREDAYNEPRKILSPTTGTAQPRSRQSARPHKA